MKIRVVPFDPTWPQEFERERAAVSFAVGEVLVRTHHIGSTAVAGLAAKPIIDLLLEVSDLDGLDERTPELVALGYEVMGEFGMPRRRYFRKGGAARTHQIHAFRAGDEHVRRHLAFRDYLRAHPAVCREYGALKTRIAAAFPEDLDGYCDGKEAFVQEHEARALAWCAKQDPSTS